MIEFTPYKAVTETVTFDLRGLRMALARLSACIVPPVREKPENP
jgi:hypothetical protein